MRNMSSGKPLKNILLKFFQDTGIQEKYEENLAIAYWDSTVGKEISRHTEPLKIVDGIVFVKVDDTVWRNELTFLKNEIIKKLNHKIGKHIVREIKFF